MKRDFVRISELISFQLNRELSFEEKKELNEFAKKYPQINKWIQNKDEKSEEVHQNYTKYIRNDILEDWKTVENRSVNFKQNQIQSGKSSRYWWAIAASLLFAALVGILFVRKNDKPRTQLSAIVPDTSITIPGSARPYLTLSNGETILLGDKDLRIEEKNNTVLNADKSILKYPLQTGNGSEMNIIRIPAGGIFQVLLSDGTRVWLNSDSELEYPSSFNAKERKVLLRGEAYFEVAKDPERPFRVSTEGTTIEAVGTAFNVNTQLNRGEVKTILTKGKIRVSDKNDIRTITPGYAAITNGDEPIKISRVDIREALAWKDGYFYLSDKNLLQILADIERWYGVKLEVDSPINNDTYQGEIKKDKSLKTVCQLIQELSGYTLIINNQTIIIKK